MDRCPIWSLFNSLSKRWTLHILKSMSDGNKWFNEIKNSILWISSKILSERLVELENDWFIKREIINIKPIRVEYTFNQKWDSLQDVILYINNWALKNN